MMLHIITPEKKESFDITWIELNTPCGNFIIQEGHIPTILSLEPDKPIVYELSNGKKESREIIGGFAHVERNGVTLLLSRIS